MGRKVLGNGFEGDESLDPFCNGDEKWEEANPLIMFSTYPGSSCAGEGYDIYGIVFSEWYNEE